MKTIKKLAQLFYSTRTVSVIDATTGRQETAIYRFLFCIPIKPRYEVINQ